MFTKLTTRHQAKIATSVLAIGLSVSMVGGCFSSKARKEAQAPSIVGKWKSAVTPMNAQQAFQLDFNIAPTTWAVDYTVFGDLKGNYRFATVHIEGPYTAGGPSALVAGAFEGKFGITKKTITPHNPDAAKYLNSIGGTVTGFQANTARDISDSGFAPFGQYPISKVNADYDIFKLDGDKLYFGDRPADNDMSTPEKRPTKLAQVYSVRY